jgi:hypothetical protein
MLRHDRHSDELNFSRYLMYNVAGISKDGNVPKTKFLRSVG